MKNFFTRFASLTASIFAVTLALSLDTNAASWPDQPGISPNRDYVNQTPGEYIDPYNGNLQLHQVDVHVPGNGGFNVKVLRSYNAQRSNETTSPFGRGWQIHFGRLVEGPVSTCVGMARMTFETADGSQQVLYRSNGIASTSTTTDFVSHTLWRAKCNTTTGKVTIYSTDGTAHEMTVADGTGKWLPSKLIDRNNLELNLTYEVMPSGSKAIKSVTNQEGRIITFQYANGALTSIGFGSRTWSYTVTNGQLTSYQPPSGGAWTYAYHSGSGADGYALRSVTRPQGSLTTYSYQTIQFLPGSTAPALQAIRTKALTLSGTTHNWTYTFTTGAQYDETTIDLPPAISNSSLKYRHHGLASVSNGNVWKVGLLLVKVLGADQVETYTWSSDAISDEDNVKPGVSVSDTTIRRPLMSSRAVTRNGGNYTTYFNSWDPISGQPTSISESGPKSRSRTLTYFNSPTKWIIGKLESESIGLVNVLDRDYNTFGDMELESKFGLVIGYGYTAGQMTSRSDGVGTINYSNFSFGVPLTESRPGATVTRSVDAFGNVATESDGLYTWGFGYDGLNRVTRVTPPVNSQVTINWTDTSKTVTRGSFTEATLFDGLGNPNSITREGVARTLSYDLLGRKVSESLPGNSGQPITTAFDLLDRPKTIASPAGNRTYGYSSTTTTLLNERGNLTTYTFDRYGDPDLGFSTGVDRGSNTNTTMVREPNGRMTSVSQGGGTIGYSYVSGTNLVSEITKPSPETSTTFTYWPSGAMKSKNMGSGTATIDYFVDGMSRTTSIQRGGIEGNVVFGYFANGKLSQITEPYAGSVREFSYDANGNLKEDKLSVGTEVLTVGYAYDSLDGLSSVTYPKDKGIVTFAPDSQGRPTSAAPFVTAIGYHPSGNVSSMSFSNSRSATFGENGWQVPNSVSWSGVVALGYSYDGVNNPYLITDDVYGSRTLTYDSADRLDTATGPWGGGNNISYDPRGNISSQALGPASLTYNYVGSRLDSLSGKVSMAFTYDTRGNVTSLGTRAFQYDSMGQLSCVGCPSAPAAEQVKYRYDGQNRRVSSTRDGRATYFFHATNGDLLFEYSPFGKAWSQHVHVHGKRVASRTGSDAEATQTTVTSSPANPTTATPVTISASVTPTAATGSIEFRRDGVLLGTVTATGGQGSIVTSLPVGTHVVVAAYLGSTSYAPSSASVTITVEKGTAAVSLTFAPASPAASDTVAVSAAISPSTATGTVTFYRDAVALGTLSLVNGIATLPSTPYAAGSYQFTATYPGDANVFGASSPASTLTVSKVATSMTLSSPTPKVLQGGLAAVAAALGGSLYFPPTGSVTFTEGGATLGTATISNSSASLGISTLAPGVHQISATYAGDSNHLAVNGASTEISVVRRVASDASFDGKSDWFYRNDATGETNRLLMNGTSVTSSLQAYVEPNTAWRIVGDGDFNADGVADLLYRNDSTGQVSLVTLNGNGVAANAQIFYTEPDLAWKVIHTPDLNGDGRADMLWWNSSTGSVFGMLMAGTTVLGQGAIMVEPNTEWRIVAVGDFSGTGKQNQLLWRNRSTGLVWMSTVNFAGGVFSETGVSVYQDTNLAWKIVAAADFNGDGKSDILYRNDATGEVWMMFMNGSTISSQASAHIEPNLAWKVVAVGDYNGDGKADLLWREEATGAVWMMLMDGTTKLASASVYGDSNLDWKLLGPWEYGKASGVLQ